MSHPEDGFVPAKKSVGQGYVSERGETLYLKKGMPAPDRLNWLNLTNSENDLVMLENVNPAVILFHIKQRYLTNQIYSYVGPILISCNPYKLLPLYTPSILNDYIKRDNRYLEPHVYAIANTAYRGLVTNGMSQSIVISGESGAGKTECTKQALQFLAEIAESENNIEQQILNANPVLEAFGNAKTVRNNNSSRFGKYLEVFLDSRNAIAGARTTNYLLEKSRVCFQAKMERNYHVFYNLVLGASKDMRKWYRLKPLSEYHYLNQSGCDKVPGLPDGQLFNNELLPAMRQLNFSEDEINSIFRIVSGILMLGNVTFKSTGERRCRVVDKAVTQDAASLLEVDPNALDEVVTKTKLKVIGQKPISVPLSAAQATSARDALSKFIYEKMFDWLVKKVNVVVAPQKATRLSIGILDIFGFEIFQVNSYEQLCINFTNEKLQQFFNFHTFKQEEECYRAEGIDFVKVPYIDNQPVLDLIERKRKGILPMVDEEIIVPKGTDTTLVQKLHKVHAKDKHYREERKKRSCLFTVVHYAGAVTYDVTGFLEKNKDRLNDEAYNLLSKTTCRFLSPLFPANRTTKQAKKSTLGYRFSRQLNALMKTLHQTQPHYIRCIKPNPNKAPLEFCGTMSFDQLRNSGVFEAVKIRRAGFPFRYSHKEFQLRFACTMPEMNGRWTRSHIDNCQTLISEFGLDTKKVQVGRTKILYRAPEHRLMEHKRLIAVERLVRVIQRVGRGFIARCLYRRMKAIVPVLERALKSRKLDMLQDALKQADGVGFEMKLIKDARWQLHVFEEIDRCEKVLSALMHENPEETFGELAATLKTCDEIEHTSEIVERARQLFVDAKRVRDAIDREGEAAIETMKLSDLKQVLDKANELKFPHRSPVIEKIIEYLYKTSKDQFVKMQLKASVKQGDRKRVIATTIKLKEISLRRTAELFRFSRFNALLDPMEWARKKLMCFDRKSLAQSMRQHSSNSIHYCLKSYWRNPKLKSTAKIMFKNILGYMGDRRYQAGQQFLLAGEICRACVEEPELRCEVYSQLMKQLTSNPGMQSAARGWDLVMICVSTFPPDPIVENHLEVFIRDKAPRDRVEKILTAMNTLQYELKEGRALAVPSAQQMNSMLSGRVKSNSFCADYNQSIATFDRLHEQGFVEAKNAVNIAEIRTTRATRQAGAAGTGAGATAESKLRSGGGGGVSTMPTASGYAAQQSEPAPQPPVRRAKPEIPEMPPNWRQAVDPESGDTYYYNIKTKETTWDKPVW